MPVNRVKRRLIAVRMAQKLASSKTIAVLAGRLFMTPPDYLLKKKDKAFLKTGNRHSIKVFRGERLLAWTWGKGPVVLFIHGWGGRGVQFKRWVQPLVDRGKQVILFDALGHGQSTGGFSSGFHIAHSIQAILSFFGAKLEGVVAHSLGSSGFLIAASHGLQCSRVVFIGSPYEGPKAQSKKFAHQHHLSEETRLLMQQHIEHQLHVPWDEFEVPYLLENFKYRTTRFLLIHDHEDRVVPVSDMNLISQHLKYFTLYQTQNLGHFRILKEDRVIQKGIQFVDMYS